MRSTWEEKFGLSEVPKQPSESTDRKPSDTKTYIHICVRLATLLYRIDTILSRSEYCLSPAHNLLGIACNGKVLGITTVTAFFQSHGLRHVRAMGNLTRSGIALHPFFWGCIGEHSAPANPARYQAFVQALWSYLQTNHTYNRLLCCRQTSNRYKLSLAEPA